MPQIVNDRPPIDIRMQSLDSGQIDLRPRSPPTEKHSLPPKVMRPPKHFLQKAHHPLKAHKFDNRIHTSLRKWPSQARRSSLAPVNRLLHRQNPNSPSDALQTENRVFSMLEDLIWENAQVRPMLH